MLPLVKKYVSDQHQSLTAKWDLDFHIYGNDKSSSSGTKQLFVVTEAVAETQQLASSLASKARVAMIVSTFSDVPSDMPPILTSCIACAVPFTKGYLW